jgi:hypothetical protein
MQKQRGLNSIDSLSGSKYNICDYNGCNAFAEKQVKLDLKDLGFIKLNFCKKCFIKFQTIPSINTDLTQLNDNYNVDYTLQDISQPKLICEGDLS